MTNTDGAAREAAARAKVAQRRREAQLVRDRENRQAFLRGYWAGMCRRNCWTYSHGTGEDVRLQVSPRRLSWRALVEMARTAESFRRAQYVHLDAASRVLSACASSEHAHTRAWQLLGEAFGVSRDLMTPKLAELAPGALGEALQAAAREYGRAGLYAIAREPLVELDPHYEDENGDAKA
jgi:hypothetical protein